MLIYIDKKLAQEAVDKFTASQAERFKGMRLKALKEQTPTRMLEQKKWDALNAAGLAEGSRPPDITINDIRLGLEPSTYSIVEIETFD